MCDGGQRWRGGVAKSSSMIEVDPRQWKKRWECIIAEDNVIICTCLWTPLNSMIKVYHAIARATQTMLQTVALDR